MDKNSNDAVDSECEVFFDTKAANTGSSPVTSTPAEKPTRKRKRRAKPFTRKKRRRSSMAGGKKKEEKMEADSGSSASSEDEEMPVGVMMKKLSKDLAKINKSIAGIQNSIRTTVNDAIEPLSKRMDRLETKQVADMEDLRASVNDKIKETIGRAQGKEGRDGKIKFSRADGTTYAAAAATQCTAEENGTYQRLKTPSNSWFWDARRCLRFFPIEGKTQEELLRSLDEFVLTKLKVPSGLLCNEDINFIRPVRATKRNKLPNEVLVSFSTVDARDLVHSYARNLGDWVGEDGKPLAGLRLEIPERLISDFKSCEQYGHAMKKKHGVGFKRHTKMDDSRLCIYMDMYLPAQKAWVRVDMDVVTKDNTNRLANSAKLTDADLLSTVDDGGSK